MTTQILDKYAIIGAGPCGVSMIRCMEKYNLEYDVFEYADEVGGIWNNDNPLSTMYDSAHLISSKSMTQYDEFPFDKDVADYPSQKVIKTYFKKYADKFELRKKIQFNIAVTNIERNSDGSWLLEYKNHKSGEEYKASYKGVILATGLFNKGNENMPTWEGMDQFKGQILHSSEYRTNETFADKNVLIVGCGNSAADIAIDAVHRAKKVHMSVRRGYYFVPKYIFGKPTDTINGKLGKIIPGFIKRKVDQTVLQWFTGDPTRFGFPKPHYKFLESHPVLNSYLLQHIGHGDISIKGDIQNFSENEVLFKDGSSEKYDVVLCATGYHIKFKYIDHKYLNWKNNCPDLHLNIFHPEYDNLMVLGLIEATGIGWQGRFDQAELVAKYLRAKEDKKPSLKRFQEKRIKNNTDLRAGMNYIKLDRMSYYVHKETYMNIIKDEINTL
jgi:thioredoxin reductase